MQNNPLVQPIIINAQLGVDWAFAAGFIFLAAMGGVALLAYFFNRL